MTRIIKIIFVIVILLSIITMIGAKELTDADHIDGEIGIATSTVAEQISEIEAPKGKILSVVPSDETDPDERARKIDSYFESRGMALAGYGEEFVSAADKYGIDWRLLPAIGVIESTGGNRACGTMNNPFGWGSCRSGVGQFDSFSEAIDYVSMNLGGHNPRTRSAYSGDTSEDLWSYNGTVDHTYPDKVMRVMRDLMETPLP